MDELISRAFIFNARQLWLSGQFSLPRVRVIDCRVMGGDRLLEFHKMADLSDTSTFISDVCQKFEDGLVERVR